MPLLLCGINGVATELWSVTFEGGGSKTRRYTLLIRLRDGGATARLSTSPLSILANTSVVRARAVTAVSGMPDSSSRSWVRSMVRGNSRANAQAVSRMPYWVS
jgi:hypothetical protein